MKFKKRYFLLPLLGIFLGYMLFSAYDEVRVKTIEEFDTQQIILAKQAAKGIKNFFHYYFRNLNHFAQMENIVAMNDIGKSLMETFYRNHSDVISAITRVDKNGRITHTIPFNKSALNADISSQKHMQTIIREHTPVVSDVFKAVQGYTAVAYHVPVFFNDTFQGTLAILIPFSKISKEYLENIKIGKGGYAWVISQGGIELYNRKSDHVGESVFNTYKAFPSMIRMLDEMVSGKQGIATYTYDGSNGSGNRKRAVYFPILLSNTYWSIVVATSEEEVLSIMKGFRNKFLLLSASLMVVGLFFSYYFIKVWAILKEEKKRKLAESALSESEKKYKSLANNLNVGIYRNTVGSKGKFIEANAAIVDMFGYDSRDEFLKVRVSDLYKNPEDRQTYNSKLLKKGSVTNVELQLQKKDGTSFIGSTSAVVVKDEMDEVKYFDGTIQDITERKHAETALRKSEEKLARSKKMESLGLLAGGVAHDLNNVLSGIVSYPELILMDLPENSKFRKPIETIKDSGQRAAAIVQDLLTVARGVASSKEALNLNEIINDYLHSPEFSKLKQSHPTVTVQTNLNADLFNIVGSHVHIRKVVMNLVSNAAEAIEGSGDITISTMNYYLDRPLRGYDDVTIGEYVVLSLFDDGSGISSEDLERIFEPFYTKKVMGRSGTGLGLAVVWNTVQDHQGYIDVKSGENGTTFELYFPITREDISDKDLSIPTEDYKGNGEMILVVDDIESQREISCRMIKKLGYRTNAVSSGEEAIAYLKTNTVDLILLDMIMDPGMNGRETYQRIIDIHPDQKAIIASGFAVTHDVKAAQKLGAGKYIKKPYSIEQIGLAIKEELGVKLCSS